MRANREHRRPMKHRLHQHTLTLATLLVTLVLTSACRVAAPEVAPPLYPTLTPTTTPLSTPFAAPRATPDEDFGGGPIEPPQDETSEEELADIRAEVLMTVDELIRGGQITAYSAEVVTFTWPLRAASELTDYGYHGVSGFVDHDPSSGALLDYTCGSRTYDLSSGYNHQGSDYFTFPFPWIKMDDSLVEIVAAAPGTLVFKRDGQYDRQCAMTGALSNAVVIRHGDGSLAHYLHMKEGSVTPKAVGQEIARGEYLGVVGSSGSSTGPHLHFEVRDATNRVVDPYEGDCNQRPSMWADQPPYYDSTVIAVHTGSAAPSRQPCPQQWITNLQKTFDPEDTVTFVTTYRDQLAGQTSTYRILKPGGTLYDTWEHASTRSHYSASYWYWTKALDRDGSPPTGTWRFEVDFEGKTYDTEFYIVGPSPQTITVTHPNGGEGWWPGTILPITWDTNRIGEVDIDLYADGVFVTDAVTGTRNDGVTFWAAPAGLEPRRDYAVRVINSAEPADYDTSDDVFTISPIPSADFTIAPSTGHSPLTVAFSNTPEGLVDSRLWTFGDGTTSTAPNPTHIYTQTGVFTVTLTLTGPTGSDTVTRTNAVTVTVPPLTADFSASPLKGLAPLPVSFTDRSVGPPADRWLWYFGDGFTAEQQNPTHVYEQTGIYSVTLTIANAEETDRHTKPSYIEVADQPWTIYLPLALRQDQL